MSGVFLGGGPCVTVARVSALAIPFDLVVVRAVVVRAGRVLLVRRSAWDTLPGTWELPGGKVDPGESPAVGLGRELREETGLRVTGEPSPHCQHALRSPSGRRVLERVYTVAVTGRLALSDEHDDALWQDLSAPLPTPLTLAAQLALGEPPDAG